MKRKWLLLPLLVLFLAKLSFGEDLILNEHPELKNWSVRSGHPRLLITPDNKQAIIERVKVSYKTDFQTILDDTIKVYGTSSYEEWGKAEILDYNETDKLREMVERCAFIYQMGDLTGFNYGSPTALQYGQEGVKALMAMLPEATSTTWNTVSKSRVRMRYTGFALGYDWLYDLLTNEQKGTITTRMMENNRFAFYPDDYKPSDKTGIGNFPRCKENISGLAFMNDGINDTAARTIIEQLYTGKRTDGVSTGLLSGGALDLLKIVCGDGITIDGMLYMIMHQGYTPFLEAWYTATGQDYFALSEFYINLPLWITYSIQPGTDYSLFRVQDMRSPSRIGDNTYKWCASGLFSGLIGPLSRSNENMAKLCKWISKELIKDSNGNSYVYEPLIYRIIMGGDPQIVSASPKTLNLPLNKRFEKHGWISMRSDWEDADATLATFMCHTYQFDRIGRFSNSFTIWKNKGSLLSNRGWGDHDQAFGDYTDSWNSFLFINNSLNNSDPNGRQTTTGGGTDFDAKIFLPPNDSNHKTGGIKYFEEKSGKYSYSYGDATNAYLYNYRQTNIDTDRMLDLFTRQFIYFCGDNSSSPESDYFVIFDRVKAKHTETEKHMLLQMSYNPVLINDNWEIANGLSGTEISPGKWQYNNPHNFVITNAEYNGACGKAFVKTLLPENTVVYKIGGPSHQFNDWYGTDSTRSKSKPLLTDEEKFCWGEYRLHILPAVKQKEDIFLHTIEATDASHTTPAPMEKISSNSIVGAKIGQYIALFNPKEEFLLSGQVFLPYQGNFNILMADLEPQRQYHITIGTDTQTINSSAAGCIFLENKLLGTNTLIIGTTTLEPDNTPPAMINNLTMSTLTSTSVSLTWTATGDDGTVGQAMGYDCRYSTGSITTATWNSCAQFSLASPKEAGQVEFGTITGLFPNTVYYLAIKAVDDQNNWSPLPTTPLRITTLQSKLICDFGQKGSTLPDGKINFEDLMWLTVYWNAHRTDSNDLRGDIAGETISGTAPDLITQPDGEVNLHDLMAFTKMWNWWHNIL